MFTAEQFGDFGQFDLVIDVRSPAEFALDHVPGAINLPVLDDAERAKIGTLHKQVSPFEAKRQGAAIVARRIGQMLTDPVFEQPREWRPLVMCWRGGKRSGSLTHILRQIGWPAMQLYGGYRAYRALVNDALTALPPQHRFVVLAGRTGSGKSRLLTALASAGAQVLDLEQLANHRGSVLGGMLDMPQPSQKWFESQLQAKLVAFKPEQSIFVESESKKIGDLRVPEALMLQMRASPCAVIETGEATRVELLMDEYAHFLRDNAALSRQLACLVSLHGRAKIEHWNQLGSAGHWPPLVQELLRDHYDPAYDRSMARNFTQLGSARTFSLQDASNASFAALARKIVDVYRNDSENTGSESATAILAG
ncbi:MAG: tRNA 2-selenouridine(34) synthase MnmH [Burkholderiaceae bacterium]